MATYINKRTSVKVDFIKETRDYSLGKLTEWVHYEQKDLGIMKLEANAFYSQFTKLK